jgi:hypothetical protein
MMQLGQICHESSQFSDVGLRRESANVASFPVCISFIAQLLVASFVNPAPRIRERLKTPEIGGARVVYVPHVVFQKVGIVRKSFALTLSHSVFGKNRGVVMSELK